MPGKSVAGSGVAGGATGADAHASRSRRIAADAAATDARCTKVRRFILLPASQCSAAMIQSYRFLQERNLSAVVGIVLGEAVKHVGNRSFSLRNVLRDVGRTQPRNDFD